ncbi:PAS domain S-box protein [Roseomonas terrae]|uniref:PAS domain S-box protein n=1 Tax=Neoroseomonas terrae TaxID=424799 RepID=A0ABS5EC12_9PROT|nr:PAS domain S-box protein [Neoroseomonas terrae]MBR0648561.1 PAS domain S-box protein [Neoroseomonas terrae]
MTPEDRSAVCEALLASTADAIVMCAGDGVIRFWSPGAERIFGFTAEEAVGQSLDIIIPEPQRARHWVGFDRVMAGGHSRFGEGELLAVPALHRDGRRISVEFTIAPVHDANGATTAMAAILRDVTARFEELRSLRRRLAASGGAPPAAGAGQPGG